MKKLAILSFLICAGVVARGEESIHLGETVVTSMGFETTLLDEPLNNLDMKNAVQMMRTFEKMVKDLNKTIIIVMHDINFTSVYSDYILAMKNGRLEHMDSCENIVVKDKLENLYEMEFDITKINNKNICVYF